MNLPDTRQDRIERALQSALELSADFAALAYTARTPTECLTLRDAIKKAIQLLHDRSILIGYRADVLSSQDKVFESTSAVQNAIKALSSTACR